MKCIGSFVIPDFYRKTKDIDYLCYFKDIPEELKESASLDNFSYKDRTKNVEYIFIDKSLSLRVWYCYNDLAYVTFLMKMAHRHFYLGKYAKSFKHLMDSSWMLKQGYKVKLQDVKLVEMYTQYLIETVYKNDSRLLVFPKLNKTKDQFFNDKVAYYVDHDSLHELVAIQDKPAYTKCLTAEVMFSVSVFNSLSYQDKVNMVLEESYVLALERCLIPIFYGDFNVPTFIPDEAFKYALTRVASNLTSGAFRKFAANNFYDIYMSYNKDYFKVNWRDLCPMQIKH